MALLASQPREKNHSLMIKKDKLSHSFGNNSSASAAASVLLCSLTLPIIFILYVTCAPSPMKLTINPDAHQRDSLTTQSTDNGTAECDLFRGHWVWDDRGSLYTNSSCSTIPHLRNCFLHGRRDRDFLHWRWKPEQCELPRFDPNTFLRSVQGKTMAFIGDSLARNQMESLLCLLSLEERPTRLSKENEDDDRFATWHFPGHNFTLKALWSQFLVTATERMVNGSSTGGFDLQLDKVDESWSVEIPAIDYAIFSDAHWFFRQNYLYQGGKLIGCVYCQAPNVTDLGPGYAIQTAFRAAFDRINNCDNCSGIFTLLRTYSPSHFENGSWNTGGGCNRTRPLTAEETNSNLGGADGEYRRIQVEEVETARKQGKRRGNEFEILDITRAMKMRPDGHPGLHWGNKWMKGYNDCIHWCLPGPVDTWNELLSYMLVRKQFKEHSRSDRR